MKNTWVFILLFACSAGFVSCGAGKTSEDIYFQNFKGPGDFPDISEMAYFPPVFHFDTEDKVALPTPGRYVFNTAEAVDSILKSNSKYRIAGKIRGSTATSPAVEKLFEQLKRGEGEIEIPGELLKDLEEESQRYALALYFEPHFVPWRTTSRVPYYLPKDGLIFYSNRLHAAIIDKESSAVLFYGNTTRKPFKHPTWDARESIDLLYRKMFN